MRRLAIGFGFAGLLAVGCSDDGVPADGTASNGSTGADDDGGDDDGTATSPTGSTTVSTTGTATSDATDDGTTGDEAGTSFGETTAVGSDDTSGTTGPAPMCESHDECVLVDDCCNCTAIHQSEEPPPCDIDACLQSTCSAMGVTMPAAVCDAGSCAVVPQSCDDSLVTCESLPPKCPPNSVPGVDANTMCWTGFCVPVELCEVVPACDFCEEGEACVEYLAQLPQIMCVPIPEACGGVPTCDCMGAVACQDPFTVCTDGPEGIQCLCPACG